MDSQKPVDSSESSWPSGSLLFWGTFGAKTPEGKRYHHRCLGALALLMVWVVAGTILTKTQAPGARTFWLFTSFFAAGVFGYIFWEFWRYVQCLDELERRIQLEAALATYATGFVVAILLGALILFYGLNWEVNPGWFVLLEPIRGLWLYAIARRY